MKFLTDDPGRSRVGGLIDTACLALTLQRSVKLPARTHTECPRDWGCILATCDWQAPYILHRTCVRKLETDIAGKSICLSDTDVSKSSNSLNICRFIRCIVDGQLTHGPSWWGQSGTTKLVRGPLVKRLIAWEQICAFQNYCALLQHYDPNFVVINTTKYSMIQKDGFTFARLYFLNPTWYVNDLHNIWKRRS
jgi:hypothetical protein